MPGGRSLFDKVYVSVVILIHGSTISTAAEPTAQSPDGVRFEVLYPVRPDAGESAAIQALGPVDGGSRARRFSRSPPVDRPDRPGSPARARPRRRRPCAGRHGDSRRQIGDLSDRQLERAQARPLRRSGPLAHQSRSELSRTRRAIFIARVRQRRARPECHGPRAPRAHREPFPPRRCRLIPSSIKYLKIQSRLLSDFHGRPIYLRAGVILPRDFAREPDRRYPLLVHIGGYASRFSDVGRLMSPDRRSTATGWTPTARR